MSIDQIVAVWLVGGALIDAFMLLGYGWQGFMQEMEEDNVGFPLLSPTQTAVCLLLLNLVVWPYIVIEACLRKRN